MLRIHDIHTDLIGKTAKLSSQAFCLASQYKEIFNLGNIYSLKKLSLFEYLLIFVDEKPEIRNGTAFFCLKDAVNEEMFWLTLDQLIVCTI